MALFKINNKDVVKLSITSINKEKDVQNIFENNLNQILNIDFLKTECSTSFGGRIDTLGIDKNGSPVIIEYKKSKKDNIINQGLSYLKWLLDHKADFLNFCNEKNINRDIDWTSPRVICIAESYNKFDLDSAEILPLKIELMKYRIYDDDILHIERESQRIVKISKSKIFKNSEKEKRNLQEIYSIERHLNKASPEIKELFLNLKEKIIGLDESILEDPKAKYIAYKLTTNFVDVVIQKNQLKLFLNLPTGKLNDPKKIARDLETPKHIGHWGNGDYEIIINKNSDLDNIFKLIKQSYNYNK